MENIKEIHELSINYLRYFHSKISDLNSNSRIDFSNFNPLTDRELDQDLKYTIKQDIIEDSLESYKDSIESHNISRIKNNLDILEIKVLDLYSNFDSQDFQSAVEAANTLLISNDDVLFQREMPIKQGPTLIKSVNLAIYDIISKDPSLLFKISPRAFEEIVAEIFYYQGFDVELTKKTRDGGKDIIAISNQLEIPLKYIIECKRYAPGNKVSLSLVQRLLGVKVANSANKAILVTTSGYTKDAINFANNNLWELALKDYNDVIHWLDKLKNFQGLTY